MHILDSVIAGLAELWWVFAIGALVGLTRLPRVKGWMGERLVRLVARMRLDSRVYRIFNDVTLPTPDGTTQIDHVFVSPYGVFVVETKNMKGWILGGERQATWTQKIYRTTRKFQNPLRQNYKHTKTLQGLLDLDPAVVHSIVVFVGGSRFMTKMPPNVVHGGGHVRYIRQFRERVFTDSEIEAICERLSQGRLASTRETHRAHVQNVAKQKRPEQGPPCPKCGCSTTLRAIRKGNRAGQRFWGCTQFPNCRGATWYRPGDASSA